MSKSYRQTSNLPMKHRFQPKVKKVFVKKLKHKFYKITTTDNHNPKVLKFIVKRIKNAGLLDDFTWNDLSSFFTQNEIKNLLDDGTIKPVYKVSWIEEELPWVKASKPLERYFFYKVRGNIKAYKAYKEVSDEQTPRVRSKSVFIPIWDDKHCSGPIKKRLPKDYKKTIRHENTIN